MTSEHEPKFKAIFSAAYGLVGVVAVTLVVGLTALAVSMPASALPAYAQQTHLLCGRCHVSPAGGGERNAFGKAFAANGHKLPSKAKPAKGGAVDATPTINTGAGGGYYSSAVNPNYGVLPEFGYSNSLMFRIDH